MIRGYEVPILVFFCGALEGQQNEHIFSRCKSELIIIAKEEDVNKIIPMFKECDFAQKIGVYGKIKFVLTCKMLHGVYC